MSEEESTNTGPDESPTDNATPAKSSVSVGRIMLIVVPIALIFVVAVVGFGLFDGAKILSNMMLPARVAATGQVMWRGQPLAGGELQTQHEEEEVTGAAGFLDDQGRFHLQTQVDGDYKDGAFVGEHKVTVTLYPATQQTPGIPPLTPKRFASFDTTPLTIVVSKSPNENTYVITLDDDDEDTGAATNDGESE